jgi:hypothetical protein
MRFLYLPKVIAASIAGLPTKYACLSILLRNLENPKNIGVMGATVNG